MYVHDVIAEMITALENHTESDGNEFEMIDFMSPGRRDEGELTVTAPDGTVSRFRVKVTALEG